MKYILFKTVHVQHLMKQSNDTNLSNDINLSNDKNLFKGYKHI